MYVHPNFACHPSINIRRVQLWTADYEVNICCRQYFLVHFGVYPGFLPFTSHMVFDVWKLTKIGHFVSRFRGRIHLCSSGELSNSNVNINQLIAEKDETKQKLWICEFDMILINFNHAKTYTERSRNISYNICEKVWQLHLSLYSFMCHWPDFKSVSIDAAVEYTNMSLNCWIKLKIFLVR